MALTPVEIQLKRVAYCLGILQGLGYAILAVICIIIYNQSTRYFSSNSYSDVVESNIYYYFLGPEYMGNTTSVDRNFRPGVFAGFVWVHFILHLIWLGLSAEALRRDKIISPRYLFAWSHFTLLICLWDFITVVIVGADYKKCVDQAGAAILYQEKCATGMLPVLVIAAKGFVLWVVNVIFAVVLHFLAKRLKQGVAAMRQPIYPPTMMSFQAQPQYPVSQPNLYPPQHPGPTPYVTQGPQNVNNNQFEYPVHIPEPDYQYKEPYSPTNKY